MSQRELRSLATTDTPLVKSRLRSGKSKMEDQLKEKLAQLEAELAGAKTALEAKDHELEQLREKAAEATSNALDIQAELKEQSQEVSALKQELENSHLRAEVDKMHALESLREEHRKELVREKEQVDFERKRAEEWVRDLKDSFNREKKQLEERVSSLEKALERPRGKSDGGASSAGDTHAPPTTAESAPSGDGASTVATTGGGDAPPPGDDSTTETTSHTDTPGHTDPAAETGGETSHSALLEKVTQLLKAQTEAMTAQAQAAAVQHLPAFHCYTGEDDQTDDEVFDRWLERFEERAKLAGWSNEQKLYHLKLHLDKTALQVFRMLPEAERKGYDEAIKALKKRFRPVDIEELRGLEFHTRVQGDESIEKLGIDIQKLGHKAFPTMKGKEFDRIIKGRFFQALHVKWQRKLEAPRPTESFSELYDRARMLERHEKQYAASAAARGDTRNTGKKDDHSQQKQQNVPRSSKPQTAKGQNEPKPVVEPSSKSVSTPKRTFHGICHRCQQYGHLARNCPGPPSGKSAHEARGRSTAETTSRTSTVESNPKPDELTEEQLEDLLSQRRLQREQALLSDSTSTASSVTASENDNRAVGPTVYIDLLINGEPVRAMVDTGAQSTIISRSMLHAIGRRAKSEGRPLPVLEQPSVRLYGKDGKRGGRELTITAELQVTLEADCKSTCVSVFVQPNSEQKCLLGMNAIPSLGISVLRANGEPLISASEPFSSKVANVCLVQSTTIPSQKGRFVKAHVECNPSQGDHLLFEPRHGTLEGWGLNTQESLLTVHSDGMVLIPIENFQGIAVTLEKGAQIGVAKRYEPDVVVVSENNLIEGSCVTVTATPDNSSERYEQLLKALSLPESDIDSDQMAQLKQLLADNTDVFALNDAELGCTNLVQHVIETGSHPPIKQQPYRTPFTQREKIGQMIDDMKERGIVKPSTSPWASPVILVPKRDGTSRFCIDYRRLNAITTKDVYPLPRIDDILDTLGEAKYFSSLDLAAGYWQVELAPDSRQKSAFTTHKGLFEFVRMPFGLCNAPATFQRVMQVVLAGLEWRSCFVYLDDILIASKTFDEHLDHLREVFDRLRKSGLRLKPRKCLLLRKEVPYLGHVISKEGIRPDPAKTEKVQRFPTPVDATKVRQFLGLASYYRRFVPGFAQIAAPLHALTKKNAVFHWTPECESAFSKLKELLTTAPVLSYPVFGPQCEFILETDASGVGLGAILAQKQVDGSIHPIAYASRTLDSHERNYGISELETLALVWAVRYFRPYLLGHHTTVYTDHAACRSLLDSARPSGKLARWALTIQEMDLTILHRSGKKNANADALSRNPASVVDGTALVHSVEAEKDPLLTQFDQSMSEIRELQQKDPDLVSYFEYFEQGVVPTDDKAARKLVMECKKYELIDGVLHFENPAFPGRWCIVVPKAVRPTLLEEAHAGCFAGHLSERKIYDRLRRSYYWQGMRSDVRRYCRSCLTCASRKGTGRKIHPPLQPIPVGGPFHRIGVDILKLPQTTSGNRYVVVFVDYLTKWPEAFAIPDQRAETIARLLCEQIICRHGIPEQLLSDRGANFLSELILEICKLLGVKKLNTSGYHPQTDGLVEKFNSTLTNMIAKSCESRPYDWDQQLPFLLFAYRISAQESTKDSPFFLLYGRDARVPTESTLSFQRSPYVIDYDDYKEELMENLSSAWENAQMHIAKAQSNQKRYYDRHADESKVRKGDRVMVFMPIETQGRDRKLARPYHGPYRVLNVTPTNVEVSLIDKPKDPSIFVSLDRVTPCYPELGDCSWTGHRKRKPKSKKRAQNTDESQSTSCGTQTNTGHRPVTRSMTRQSKV